MDCGLNLKWAHVLIAWATPNGILLKAVESSGGGTGLVEVGY